MRLIDADKLKQKIAEMQQVYNEPYEHYDNGYQDAVSQIDDVLDSLPTIDPVKHGEWIEKENDFGFWRCSRCSGLIQGVLPARYCPHCGSIMTGKMV